MKKKKETIAREALRLLGSVPADKFIIGKFSDSAQSACCAVGHYQRLKSKKPNEYSYHNCCDGFISPLRISSNDFFSKKHCIEYTEITDVNNTASVNGYTEPEIKDRVIHLLKDMVEAGY